MNQMLSIAVLAIAASPLMVCCSSAAAEARSTQRMLAHNVFFALKDASPKAKKKLVAECKKYLSKHPGIVWFAAGPIVAEHQRDVNDRDFDVALHIVFKSVADHDRYQEAKSHHAFIECNQNNWKSVRVFDSWLDVTSHADEDEDD